MASCVQIRSSFCAAVTLSLLLPCGLVVAVRATAEITRAVVPVLGERFVDDAKDSNHIFSGNSWCLAPPSAHDGYRIIGTGEKLTSTFVTINPFWSSIPITCRPWSACLFSCHV